MLAESGSSDLSASSSLRAIKKWDVVDVKGYEEWIILVDALVAADSKVQPYRGIDDVTPTIVATANPAFTTLAPAQQHELLQRYAKEHEEAVNGLYLRVLSTIDISKDSTLLRTINSTISPQPGRPARVWRLLAELRSRGDKRLRTNQATIEQRVEAFVFPFAKPPTEMTRALTMFVADFDDLDHNKGRASNEIVMRRIIAQMRKGGAHWQHLANSLDLQLVEDVTKFADLEDLFTKWEQSVFIHYSKLDESNAPVMALAGEHDATDASYANMMTYMQHELEDDDHDTSVLVLANKCGKCDLECCDGNPTCVAFQPPGSPFPRGASGRQMGYATFLRFYLSKNPTIKNAKNVVLPPYDKNSRFSAEFKKHKEELKAKKPASRSARPAAIDGSEEGGVTTLDEERGVDDEIERWQSMTFEQQQQQLGELTFITALGDDQGDDASEAGSHTTEDDGTKTGVLAASPSASDMVRAQQRTMAWTQQPLAPLAPLALRPEFYTFDEHTGACMPINSDSALASGMAYNPYAAMGEPSAATHAYAANAPSGSYSGVAGSSAVHAAGGDHAGANEQYAQLVAGGTPVLAMPLNPYAPQVPTLGNNRKSALASGMAYNPYAVSLVKASKDPLPSLQPLPTAFGMREQEGTLAAGRGQQPRDFANRFVHAGRGRGAPGQGKGKGAVPVAIRGRGRPEHPPSSPVQSYQARSAEHPGVTFAPQAEIQQAMDDVWRGKPALLQGIAAPSMCTQRHEAPSGEEKAVPPVLNALARHIQATVPSASAPVQVTASSASEPTAEPLQTPIKRDGSVVEPANKTSPSQIEPARKRPATSAHGADAESEQTARDFEQLLADAGLGGRAQNLIKIGVTRTADLLLLRIDEILHEYERVFGEEFGALHGKKLQALVDDLQDADEVLRMRGGGDDGSVLSLPLCKREGCHGVISARRAAAGTRASEYCSTRCHAIELDKAGKLTSAAGSKAGASSQVVNAPGVTIQEASIVWFARIDELGEWHLLSFARRGSTQLWTIGGKLKPGETPPIALLREIDEEIDAPQPWLQSVRAALILKPSGDTSFTIRLPEQQTVVHHILAWVVVVNAPPDPAAADWLPALKQDGEREAEPGTYGWRPASKVMANLLSFDYAAPHAAAVATLISAAQVRQGKAPRTDGADDDASAESAANGASEQPSSQRQQTSADNKPSSGDTPIAGHTRSKGKSSGANDDGDASASICIIALGEDKQCDAVNAVDGDESSDGECEETAIALITSQGKASTDPLKEFMWDTGAGSCFVMRSLNGADPATRGPPKVKSIGGFVGGGAAPVEASYLYSLTITSDDGKLVDLPPFRADHCPAGKTSVVPVQTYAKLIGADFGGGASGNMWMQMPPDLGGTKIIFTHDARNLPWSAFQPTSVVRANVLTLSLAEGPPPTAKRVQEMRALNLTPSLKGAASSQLQSPLLLRVASTSSAAPPSIVPIVLTGSLARERAACMQGALAPIMPGAPPTSRGRRLDQDAKGNGLGPSVGKPAVAFEPVEMLRFFHHLLNHASTARIMEFAKYYYPHVAAKIEKKHVDEYNKEPCPACNRYLGANLHAPAVMPQADNPTAVLVIDAFGPLATPSAEHGFTYAIAAVYPSTGRGFLYGAKSLTTQVHVAAARAVMVKNRARHPDTKVVLTDALRATTQAYAWQAFADDMGFTPQHAHAGGHWFIGDVETVWRLWRRVKAQLAQSRMGAEHWYTCLSHVYFCAQLALNRRDQQDRPISSFALHEGYDLPVETLEAYGCPCWYVTDPMLMGTKFKAHAKPARYVGQAPNAAHDQCLLYVLEGHLRHVQIPLGLVKFDRAWATKVQGDPHTIDAAIERLTSRAMVVRPQTAPIPNAVPPDATHAGIPGVASPPTQQPPAQQPPAQLPQAQPPLAQPPQAQPAQAQPIPRQHLPAQPPQQAPPAGRQPQVQAGQPQVPLLPQPTLPPAAMQHMAQAMQQQRVQPQAPAVVDDVPVEDKEPGAACPLRVPDVHSHKRLPVVYPPAEAISAGEAVNGGLPERRSIVTVDVMGYQMPISAMSVSQIDAIVAGCAAYEMPGVTAMEAVACLEHAASAAELIEQAEMLRRTDHVGIAHNEVSYITATQINGSEIATITERLEIAAINASSSATEVESALKHVGTYLSDQDASIMELDDAGRPLAIFVDADTGERLRHGDVFLFDAATADEHARDFCGEVLAVGEGNYIRVTKDGKFEDIHEPVGYGGYLKSPIKARWRIEMIKEVEQINGMSCVKPTRKCDMEARGKKAWPIVWIFKVKRHADGSLDKLKARMCICGKQMQQGDDYWESYATGAKWMSFRCVFALCAVYGLKHDFHWDVSGAFLVPEMDSEMFIMMPPGFQEYDHDGEPLVWQVLKGIYGAPPSMRLFKMHLHQRLKDRNFVPMGNDDNVWMFNDEKIGVVLFACHVDEGVGAASTREALDYMLDSLRPHYKITVGPWHTVYGFGITRDIINHSVSISATRQIEDAAVKHIPAGSASFEPKMPYGKGLATIRPLAAPKLVGAIEPVELIGEDAQRAQSLTGALTFTGRVRIEASLPTALTARRMARPTAVSYACDVCTLRYLVRTKRRTLTFGGGGRASLFPVRVPQAMPFQSQFIDFMPHGFADSNLEDPIVEARSMTGAVLMLAGGAVWHVAQRQHSRAVDITAGEIFAQSTLAANAVYFIEWLEDAAYVFPELLKVIADPIKLYCDNRATVLISQDATSAKKVPYVMRRACFLLELTASRYILLVPIGTDFNVSDLFTKVLAIEKFNTFTAYILGEMIK